MKEQIKQAIEGCGVNLAPADVETILAAVMSVVAPEEAPEAPSEQNSDLSQMLSPQQSMFDQYQ